MVGVAVQTGLLAHSLPCRKGEFLDISVAGFPVFVAADTDVGQAALVHRSRQRDIVRGVDRGKFLFAG